MVYTKKTANIPILIGMTIFMFLLFIIVFGDFLMTADPHHSEKVSIKMRSDGTADITPHPLPPSPKHLLGTDKVGRDIYNQLIYGARFTLGITLLTLSLRVLIALPIAYWAAFGNKVWQRVIKQTSIFSTAVPVLLINYIILSHMFFKKLELNQSVFAFSIVIAMTEWGRLSKLFQGKIEEILSQNFIREGDRVIGKTKFQIATRSVAPHLAPFLVIYFSLEMSRILLLLLQLGCLGIFIGNHSFIDSTILLSYEPEWAAMLSGAHRVAFKTWWVIVFPALAFFICILGFNMIGEGLRKEFEREDSKLMKYITKFFLVLTFKKASKILCIKKLINFRSNNF